MMPGAQGAVGSTQIQIEWRHSNPHMALRYDPEFAGKRSMFHGSNVTAGQVRSYCSGGGPARVMDSALGDRGSFKNLIGYTYEDIVQNPDRSVDATFASIPDYTWRNTVGQLLDATHTADSFPVGNGLVPHSGVPRGGSYPTIVSQNAGNVPAWVGVDPNLNINVVAPHGEANSLERDIFTERNTPMNANQGRSHPPML